VTDTPFSLHSKTVVVVGASSGIGAATASLANQLGAHVVLAGRRREPLEAIRDSLPNPDATTVTPFDYLDAQSVGGALAGIRTVDHVVIPAVADENKKRGSFSELSSATMQASFDKFWGQVTVLRAVLPIMAPDASAVLFSSIAGLKPAGKDSGLSIMNGVQAAVMQLGRSLAVELAPRRVNVIAPGVVLTNVWTPEQRDELTQWMERDLPVARAGLPEHIAHATVSLMTNPYATGIVLPLDGGLHLI
jgi:NAD(P)-dependent dehydrogenase (short-subunit alcohol dehydrogenase family)